MTATTLSLGGDVNERGAVIEVPVPSAVSSLQSGEEEIKFAAERPLPPAAEQQQPQQLGGVTAQADQRMSSSVQEKIEWAESVFRRRPKERKPCPGHELVEDRHKWIEQEAFRRGVKIERELEIRPEDVEKNRLKWLAEEEQASARRWSMPSAPTSAAAGHRQIMMMINASSLLDDPRRHSTGHEQHLWLMSHHRNHSQQELMTMDARQEGDQLTQQPHGLHISTNLRAPGSGGNKNDNGTEEEPRDSPVTVKDDGVNVTSWQKELKQRAEFSRELVREIAESLSSAGATTTTNAAVPILPAKTALSESAVVALVASAAPSDTAADVVSPSNKRTSLGSFVRQNARLIENADLPAGKHDPDALSSVGGVHKKTTTSSLSSSPRNQPNNNHKTTKAAAAFSEHEGTEISSTSSQKSFGGSQRRLPHQEPLPTQQSSGDVTTVGGGDDRDVVDPVFQVSSCGQTDVQCLDYCTIL